MMNEVWIQILTIIVSNLVVMLTFFGITVSLHNGMRDEMRMMSGEMKDFHGRMCALEERRRKNDNES